jgi:hypothetical protein
LNKSTDIHVFHHWNPHLILAIVNQIISELQPVLRKLADDVMFLVTGFAGQPGAGLKLLKCTRRVIGRFDCGRLSSESLGLPQRLEERIGSRRHGTDLADVFSRSANKIDRSFCNTTLGWWNFRRLFRRDDDRRQLVRRLACKLNALN